MLFSYDVVESLKLFNRTTVITFRVNIRFTLTKNKNKILIGTTENRPVDVKFIMVQSAHQTQKRDSPKI